MLMSSSFLTSYRKYKILVGSCWYAARCSHAILSACTIPVMMGINRAQPILQISMSLRTPGVGWGSYTERTRYYSPFSFKLKSNPSIRERGIATTTTISLTRKVNNHNIMRMKVSAMSGENAP